MIRLGNYGISVSDRCYEVGKIATRIDKKTGNSEEILVNSGYYTALDLALKAAYRRITADAIKSYDGDLKGAIELVRKRSDAFEKLVRDALPDIKIG